MLNLDGYGLCLVRHADTFYDPLEDTLDDLASEWSGASEEEDQLVWGE